MLSRPWSAISWIQDLYLTGLSILSFFTCVLSILSIVKLLTSLTPRKKRASPLRQIHFLCVPLIDIAITKDLMLCPNGLEIL